MCFKWHACYNYITVEQHAVNRIIKLNQYKHNNCHACFWGATGLLPLTTLLTHLHSSFHSSFFPRNIFFYALLLDKFDCLHYLSNSIVLDTVNEMPTQQEHLCLQSYYRTIVTILDVFLFALFSS